MGLFDKKFCDICGEKVNMLTQQKLSDGYLCSDCKHKLGSFTSGWKQRTVEDVKRHLQLREENKTKYQQFNCSATAGSNNRAIQVDFNNRWFIFAIDNRDYKSGNPQVFDFSQLQDFWIELEYRTLSDSDHDGIPDSRDNYDNRQSNSFFGVMNNMMNMQNNMLNIPLSVQPFVRNSNTSNFSSGVKEVSEVKACFSISGDPYITSNVSFSIDYISSNNQMELMNAYETASRIMQLCQQIKQGGAQQPMGGYNQQQPMGGYNQQQPMNGYNQQQQMNGFNQQQPMNGYAQQQQMNGFNQQQPMNGYGQQQQMNGYNQQQPMVGYNQQPVQNAVWICPNCGAQNSTNFCNNCGTPRQ
ncbi:MAG: DUF4428 domain-containing protein [Ruminococcus sp.]|nr:DUF4428 domain-containing protein [Ruminococcus sp.]